MLKPIYPTSPLVFCSIKWILLITRTVPLAAMKQIIVKKKFFTCNQLLENIWRKRFLVSLRLN